MKPRVKICGITNAADAEICVESGVDALGFIFYKKSPRYIEPSRAKEIISSLPPFVTPVGVFVNEARDIIDDISRLTGIRALQFSGDESPAECNGYSLSTIKAFRFSTVEEVSKIDRYTTSLIMIDGAKDGEYGGTGNLVDFSIAAKISEHHPLMLAGGLRPDNVIEAVKIVKPYAIDVNSGVEMEPGRKDSKKIHMLFERLQLLA